MVARNEDSRRWGEGARVGLSARCSALSGDLTKDQEEDLAATDNNCPVPNARLGQLSFTNYRDIVTGTREPPEPLVPDQTI